MEEDTSESCEVTFVNIANWFRAELWKVYPLHEKAFIFQRKPDQ